VWVSPFDSKKYDYFQYPYGLCNPLLINRKKIYDMTIVWWWSGCRLKLVTRRNHCVMHDWVINKYSCGNTHISSYLFPLFSPLFHLTALLPLSAHPCITGDPWPRTQLTRQYKATGSSARCGTMSHSISPSPTGAKATHGTSPDNRLHGTDLLSCSHTGPLRASPDNRLSRWIHSLDLCVTLDNQLPRTDSLVCSSTGSNCTSSPTDYPGTQTPVAGCQGHIASDHLAATVRTQHDTCNTTAQHRNAPAHWS